jgi:hypothetical protein
MGRRSLRGLGDTPQTWFTQDSSGQVQMSTEPQAAPDPNAIWTPGPTSNYGPASNPAVITDAANPISTGSGSAIDQLVAKAQATVASGISWVTGSVSSNFPWGKYSVNTVALQNEINDINAAALAAGKISSYCKLTTDGKLGAGTCGATKAAGVLAPTTCQSFGTNCAGTMVTASTPVPTPVAAPKPVYVAPKAASPVATPAPVAPPAPTSKLQSILNQIKASPYFAIAGTALGILASAYQANPKMFHPNKSRKARRRGRR